MTPSSVLPAPCSLTVLVLTFNEQDNIARTLDALRWAREVLIVDSFSTDETLSIASRFPNVRVVQRRFDSFADQCNFGLNQVTTPWVLSLDADYVLSPELQHELQQLVPPEHIAGYRAGFVYCIGEKQLRGTLYPPRIVLYRRDRARYENEGHGHRVRIDGNTADLRSLISHDDRKPLSRWLNAQRKYAALEAEHLLRADPQSLSRVDRLRRSTCLAPLLSLIYTLFIKGLILDGPPGWFYCLQRAYAELLLTLHLLDIRLTRRNLTPPSFP
jgi:glycosyltransferase involved in cell wall biosynthesis